MTKTNNVTTQSPHSASLSKRMLQGAGIALTLISIFLLSVDEPNQNWPKLWMIKPLVIVPLAGALGGAFYYFMDHLLNQDGWRKALALIIGLLGYIFVLWLGTVLGLNGTLWD